jgi:hypothetical protein
VHNNTPDCDEFQDGRGNWQRIGVVAGRMITAWDQAEEREEAAALVTYSTDRQRALIFQALWLMSTAQWRQWAKKWLCSDGARLERE